MIETLAALFIAAPFFNLYFVIDGWRVYRMIEPPSRLLFLLFLVKLVSELAAIPLAYLSAAYLLGYRPVPAGALALIVGLMPVLIIPALVHVTVARILANRE